MLLHMVKRVQDRCEEDEEEKDEDEDEVVVSKKESASIHPTLKICLQSLGVYFLVCFVTFHIHYAIQRHHYLECRSTLWKSYTSNVSPYCTFLKNTIQVVEDVPKDAARHVYTLLLGPFMELFNKVLKPR
jgi:hypothetical protein